MRPIVLLMAIVASLVFVSAPQASPEFTTGFNQGWIDGSYGHSFNEESWNEDEARRLLLLTARANGRLLRIWLFEGASQWQVRRDAYDKPLGLAQGVLENFTRFLQLARQEGVQIYLTLFDANVAHQLDDPHTRSRYWNLLNEKYGHGQAFRERVLAPVLAAARSVPGSVWAVDLANEINVFTGVLFPRVKPYFEDGWKGANAFVARWGSFIRARGFPVTASIGWGGAANDVLAGRLDPRLLDFIDLHVYSDSGSIPKCRELGAYARRHGRQIYLGEFGQKSAAYSDETQARSTRGFLASARDCGFAGALAWRLSDIRPGHNPEARHSYEAFGRTRPAYEIMAIAGDEFNP
jgi:hypothetical protein